MNLSILIPTHNRKNILREGLDSLYQSIDNQKNDIDNVDCIINVIVIDDGSVDGSSLMIKEFFPDVIVIEGDGDFWWTKAINVGAEYAINKLNSDFIVLWNDDILSDVNYFKNLVDLLSVNKENIIVGSKILDYTNKELWSSVMFFNKLTGHVDFVSRKNNFNKKIHYKWLTGMGVVVSAKIIKKLNYWDDKNFPQYFGDMDFTLRASKIGIDIVVEDNLLIYNRTEYSSYKGKNLKTFIASLKSSNIGSRYNMLIRYNMLKTHCESKLWVFTYLLFYIKYFVKTFIIKR